MAECAKVAVCIIVNLMAAVLVKGIGDSTHPGFLFVFGDSYADPGNHNQIDPHLTTPWRAPYGETWPGKPAGKFSDGSVLTDFIAQYLNISSPLPYSEWATGNLDVNFSGINFAFGGSGVFDTFGPEFPNISVQIDQLNEILMSNYTWWEGRLANSTALFSYSGNDYISLLNTRPGIKLPFVIPRVVNQIVADLSRLYDVGIRRFLVTALEPAGCLPALTLSSNFTRCNQTYNVWSSLHNGLLASSLNKLQKRPGAQVNILDQFNSFRNVLSTALKHGFSGNPLQPCCLPMIGASCGAMDSQGKALYTVCSAPQRAFFWDGAHPTQAGWSAVSEQYKQLLAAT